MAGNSFFDWASTLAPLIFHCAAAIGIVGFLANYVNGRHFKLTERMPWETPAPGTTVRLSQYVLLQSDIAAIISGVFVVLHWASMSWLVSLRWRSAYLLMEETGLSLKRLNRMIAARISMPAMNSRQLPIFMILFVPFLAQVLAPLLTGSITWVPSSRLVIPQSDISVTVPVVVNSDKWNTYIELTPLRQQTAREAAALASLAWGRDAERGVLKRVLPSIARLNINSTITNVTLPFFSVTALDWIRDPLNTLPPDQLDISRINSNMSASGVLNPLQPGVGAVIRDAWSASPFPSPSAASETRTLVLCTHRLPEGGTCQSDNSEIFGGFPADIGFLQRDLACYAFARVTYSAGASVCTNCRVSSHLTVQNDSALSLREDPMTIEALRLMSDVTVLLVQANSSISFARDSVNDYVVELLYRSYSGSWTALTSFMGQSSVPLSSQFSVAVSSVRAQVSLGRVYAWLAVQLLLTISAVLFFWIQSKCQFRLIGSTALAGFNLNTADGTESGTSWEDTNMLKLHEGKKVSVQCGP